MIAPERLAQVFVEVADSLVDEFDVIDFMQTLATRTSELVETDAVGLLLAGAEGRLHLVAASDERTEKLELFQVQVHEGPCQDCYSSGKAVVNADLTSAADRWPSFAPRAVSAGYRSVHAFPLRLRGQILGAMNLFGDEMGELSEADASVIQALADVASIALLQERAITKGEQLTEQLQGALNSRIVIEQAKGALAQTHNETPDEAFNRLRTYCRENHLRLGEVALAVTTDPGQVRELLKPS